VEDDGDIDDVELMSITSSTRAEVNRLYTEAEEVISHAADVIDLSSSDDDEEAQPSAPQPPAPIIVILII